MQCFDAKQPRARWTVLVSLVAVSFSSTIQAQPPEGEIRLQVTDPSGVPMEAVGQIQNNALGVSRRLRLDAQGQTIIRGLPFGRYQVQLSKSGFATQILTINAASAAPVSQTIVMTLATPGYSVDVVGSTPLSNGDLLRENASAPVQAATQRDIAASGAIDLLDFLNRRFSGVYLNEVQGNPFQPDLNYRGYTASPLLGTPQGLSIYMDGVRLNQPFGDVVSWDLIPRVAIAETTLIAGSNPLFGLNTLGGAVSVETKDGLTQPGTTVQLAGGSWGRRMAEIEHGGSNPKGLNWYVAGNLFFEDGWRANSPSNVRQLFGKLGWQHAKTTFGLSVAYANNSLIGNGLQEQQLLTRDYSSIYTKPDITNNRSPFLNFRVQHHPSASLAFSGIAYYRHIRTSTLNGDINEDSLDQSVYQPSAADIRALTAAGYTGFPLSGANAVNTPFPSWRCIAQALLRDEPAEKCNGLLNRTWSKQQNYGLSGQFQWLSSLFGKHHQFIGGAAYDRSTVGFQQSSQLGYLNPDRSVTGVNAFGDGVTGGDVDGLPYDTRVNLDGRLHTSSLYATDTLTAGRAWNVTISGRYNRTIVNNSDRVIPGGGVGSLDSHNVYNRFNPSAGFSYRPARLFTTYFSYSEGSRAPTSIELGCADPNQPCKLPNALAGDPPLRQVVTRTLEAGLRGSQENKLSWSAGWFRGENRDDLLFVASSQTGFGYFKNFGKTRRQGLEVNLNSRFWRMDLGGSYTFLDATYQSPETVDGSSNSTNAAALAGQRGLQGTIQIRPGNQIPLVPRNLLKAFAVLQATSRLSLNLDLLAAGRSYARGNENNLAHAEGVYYLGSGVSPGYALVNLGGRFEVHRRIQLFAQINNLSNRRYYSGAQLSPTGFTASGEFFARPFPAVNGEFPVQHATFFAPGAPRTIWGGLRFRF